MVFIVKYEGNNNFICKKERDNNAEINIELYPNIRNTQWVQYMSDYSSECEFFNEINILPVWGNSKKSYEISQPFVINKDYNYNYTVSNLIDCICLCVVNDDRIICCHLATGMYMSNEEDYNIQEVLKVSEIARLMSVYGMNNNSKLILFGDFVKIANYYGIKAANGGKTCENVLTKIRDALRFKEQRMRIVDFETRPVVYLNQVFTNPYTAYIKDQGMFDLINDEKSRRDENFNNKRSMKKPRTSKRLAMKNARTSKRLAMKNASKKRNRKRSKRNSRRR
jgi:hypothetical protein